MFILNDFINYLLSMPNFATNFIVFLMVVNLLFILSLFSDSKALRDSSFLATTFSTLAVIGGIYFYPNIFDTKLATGFMYITPSILLGLVFYIYNLSKEQIKTSITYIMFLLAGLGIAGVGYFIFTNFQISLVKDIMYGNYYIYFIHNLFYMVVLALFLYKNILLNRDESVKGYLKTWLGTFFVLGFISLFTNVFLPLFSQFSYQILGIIFTKVMFIWGFYYVIRYKMFDIKLLFTEAFIVVITGFAVFKIFLSYTKGDLTFNSLYAFSLLVLGYLFIRTSFKSQKQRQDIEILSDSLRANNAKLIADAKLKDDILNIIHHQLNTPSSIIRSSLSMYKDKLYTYEQLEKSILTSIDRMNDTVDMFAKANELTVDSNLAELESVDIVDMINKITQEKTPIIEGLKRKVNIIISDNRGLAKGAYGYNLNVEGRKLKQIISNLIDNAVYYTKEGEIKISLDNMDNGIQKGVRISVKDSGIGIPQEEVGKLFQKFVRASNARSIRPDGNGLGLFIVKRLSDVIGVNIKAESEGVGKGSTFILEVPNK